MTTKELKLGVQWDAMQFSDHPEQHAHDARAVFAFARKHRRMLVGGSEAGRSNSLFRDLPKYANEFDYDIFISPYGEWAAVDTKQATMVGHHWNMIIPGLKSKPGNLGHSPRGIVSIDVDPHNQHFGGLIHFGVGHWLTDRSEANSGKSSNDRIASEVGRWGHAVAAGSDLAIYAADCNDRDDKRDVFRGQPFTSVADELGQHPSTHGLNTKHGTDIDVIATFDHDGRVHARRWHVYDDSELHLFTDHFLCHADLGVEPVKI